MKSIKYLMVALTLTMSVFLSSCLDGSSDNTVSTASILRYSYTRVYFDASGFSYSPVNSTHFPPGSVGDMYYVQYQYDSSLVKSTTKGISITLLSSPICIDGPVNNTEVASTNAFYGIQYLASGYKPALFDKNTLIVPILYWYYPAETTDDLKKEVAKHTFKLYYVADEIKPGDTVLNLYITHQIKETGTESMKRTKYTLTYQSYNLYSALAAFKEVNNGATPKTLVIHGKINTSSDSLDGATEDKIEVSELSSSTDK